MNTTKWGNKTIMITNRHKSRTSQKTTSHFRETNPAEVMAGMENDKRLLGAKNQEYLRLVQNRAEARKVYRMAYKSQLLRERADGQSITLVKDIVNGDRDVAQYELNYEIELGIEKACLESMKDIRSSIDAARSLLTWFRNEKYNQ